MIERPSVSDVGLPEEQNVVRLDYHELTRTIIAHTCSPDHTSPLCGQLFFRSATDVGYQPIEPLTAGASIESVAIDPHRPLLYFLTTVWREHSSGWGGDADGLYRFDLGEHRCERLVGPNELTVPAGCERVFLRSLLSASADGRSLFCKTGFVTPATFELRNGPVRGGRVDYWIARLDLASRELAPLSELTAFWA